LYYMFYMTAIRIECQQHLSNIYIILKHT